MDIIHSDNAPEAKGPYSQAVRSGAFLFMAGQIALDPQSGKLVAGDIGVQVQQIFRNIEAVLNEAGLTLAHIVKTTIFLKNMDDFPEVNAVYEACLNGHKPARSTVEVARLPLDAQIEIECIAENRTPMP